MAGMLDRGAVHKLTLRFLDDDLEAAYQLEGGASGLAGYRTITAATMVLWAIAAPILPLGTSIPPDLSWVVAGSMSVVGALCLLFSGRAKLMNQQHGLASLLTTGNGLVILLLAYRIDSLAGYAVSAILLLYLFGFVSQTRFVYATVRTLAIAIGFAVAAVKYQGDESLVIDSFILAAASVGSLLGLRLLERNRRGVWHQRLVIEEQTEEIEGERAKSDRLLLNVLPASITKRIKEGEHPIADSFDSVSVVFTDIVKFTPIAASLQPSEVIAMLSDLFSHFDDLVTDRRLEKIKTIGDSYMAVGGLPEPLEGHAERAIDLALAMLECTKPNGQFEHLAMRIGIHSGPAAGGVIGSRKFTYDVWGDTVNIASRLEQTGVPGRVHVSESTRSLCHGRFLFESRGGVDLRGVGPMNTYLVVDP